MKNSEYKKYRMALMLFFVCPSVIFSQNAVQTPSESVFSNALFNTLLILIIALLIIIAALSAVIRNLGDSDFLNREKKGSGTGNTGAALTVIFTLFSLSSYSQNTSANLGWSVGGLDSITFFFMLAVILFEGILIASLIGVIRRFTKPLEETKPVVVKPRVNILDKLNDAVDVEQEAEILLDHDYDGIRELDNNLPPWWKYGFYLTIIVAFVYMIHYHVAKTGSLQANEYLTEIKNAELEIAEFMKTSASNVDESTVKMLSDETDLQGGRNVFINTCAACHGKFGEGGVGPNLTDDYWVHGGSIRDLFKTIKYGWPDKGMKSWKEDLSPVQIAQVSSFIRTLRGTNPPNAKEKQGDLYIEETPHDSLSVKVDSVNISMVTDPLRK